MSYPTATGFPNHSGSYIPRLYSAKLLVEFYKASVFGDIATTEYEGQISKMGDTLRIRTLPDIAIKTYVKGQKLKYETPEGGYLDLLIDKGKYWAVSYNELDKKQIDINYVQQWAEHAGSTMKVSIDADVLQNTYSDADAANQGTTAGVESGNIDLGVTTDPVGLLSTNIIETIVNCGVVLDEQNVPDENRWFVLPAWAIGLLKNSDIKDASLTGDGKSALRNGRVGMIDRFTIYMSNNLKTVTDTVKCTNCMFGHKSALAFASQMTAQETIDNPDDFGKLIRALQAYGYKVVKPEALGLLYAKKATA
jgi:hypothetical protein